MRFGATLAGLVVALAVATPAQAEHLYPRNECRHLDGYAQFERTLVTAVANRFAPMLEPIVDPDIFLDFGGGAGWEEFLRRLDNPEEDLWSELSKTIALGCASDADHELAYPWLWSQDLGFEDAYSTFVTLGSAVPLRSAPDNTASVIRNLNWEAVEMMPPYRGDEVYLRVRTQHGEEGYVRLDQLRSEIDFRLLAVRNQDTGAWRITNFLAGD